MSLTYWRTHEWTPALEAADVDHGTPYTLRHTFCANAIAAGLGLFEVARFMGTSLQQINATYGHLVEGGEDAALAKLDAAAGGSGV
jgi:integrase